MASIDRVDRLADDLPALAGLVDRLRARIGEELDGEQARAHVVLGGVLVLLALMEHAHANDMRFQFPDLPTGGPDDAEAGSEA